jgi:hypothetical protein
VYATLLTPHIVKLLRADVRSCILDGEMMGWNQDAKCYKSKGKSVVILYKNFISLSIISFFASSGSSECQTSPYCLLNVHTP